MVIKESKETKIQKCISWRRISPLKQNTTGLPNYFELKIPLKMPPSYTDHEDRCHNDNAMKVAYMFFADASTASDIRGQKA